MLWTTLGLLDSLRFTNIDVAEDGQSDLEKIGQKQYGLLISDWEMPQMSGEEFAKAVQQHAGYTGVPIIVITAAPARGASWLAGAGAFLGKPFTQTSLEHAIETAARS